ncbi:MAG: glycosyltransferase, partial [Flavobacteriales bacterium]|nr:glycosyltransferase [Flavobacteriales bacterium]
GMPELIEVLKNPGTANPFEFEFVGPVNASNRVNAPQIKYHGIVTGQKALQGILDQCHVMVVPSWSEGMPNVIMEGMARGLAIVATDVGAVQALVTEKNGRLISPGSVADLRRALVQMTEVSAAQLDQMRHHSRQHVETFVWERVVKMVEKQIAQRKH